MTTAQKVYALHDFDAENPDEVSFKAGEAIIVVEKDDAYGDGWWQGTNVRGETGLFPFSYTSFDAELAKGAVGTASGEGIAGAGGPTNGKVMNSTMADIDEALAGLRTNDADKAKGIAADRRSLNSEQTGDYSIGETEENGGNAEDDYEARAKARAALAVNAAKNQEDADEAEKEEQARMKAQALRVFEEEEEKQRQLLLKREMERKEAAAQGTLQEEEKPKVAPIPGLDMSDESDSEGSEGPDFDDGLAPIHAPLFGGPATSGSGRSVLASEALRSVAPSPNNTSAVSSGLDVTPKDQAGGILERQQQQPRSLSPIPSLSAHSQGAGANQTALFAGATSAAAAGVAAGAYATSQQNEQATLSATPTPKEQVHSSSTVPAGTPFTDSSKAFDERSFSSSKVAPSTVPDSPAPGIHNFGGTQNGTSVGTAPTSLIGTETPKSQMATQQSPSPSVSGSRPTGPGGDPHEWTVDQVVEWGRSKGWDEAQVVSKFAEHEISGDVLMEMDVNILKEIDIIAFGKRFQVSNAIKDLKKGLQGGEPSSTSWSPMPDSAASPLTGMNSFQSQQQQQRSVGNSSDPPSSVGHQFATPGMPASAASAGMGAAAASGLVAASGLPSSQPAPSPRFDIVQPSNGSDAANAGWTQSSTGSPMGAGPDREVMSDGEAVASPSPYKYDMRPSMLNASGDDSSFISTPASPRKRESGGSTKNGGDRTSFFAGFNPQKSRKPAPKVAGQGGSSVDTSESNNKGTFSRLGFNRLKTGSSTPSEGGHQDLRNKISLPTTSPTYDSMGDTARRNRASQQSSGSNNGPVSSRSAIPTAGFGAHQKQASVGSAGISAADWHGPTRTSVEPRSPGGAPAEGPVMLRIRPVDHEGWMRKKGERYNSWKPRYLALKGSDLVLLRDPTAAKIKGYVSMKGYKVIADENTNPGKYGFKILHESEKPHYFSSDDAILVREWMKALMKATIDRDTSLPVISSYNNATISLKEAQRMNPPPRPPSPTSRARAQRATARANKDQLTAKDASVLMGLHQTNDARQMGFIVPSNVPSNNSDWVNQKRNIGIEENSTKTTTALFAKCSPAIGLQQHATSPVCVAQFNETTAPFATVAPWLAREQDGGKGKEPMKIEDIRLKFAKRKVAPLMTHGLLLTKSNLPILETTIEQDVGLGYETTKPLFSSPTPPTPLPKSCESDTMGCAELPPPPPPSHSPNHKYKIQFLVSKRKGNPPAAAAEQTFPFIKSASSGEAPTPISKGLSSTSSYPTLSINSSSISPSRAIEPPLSSPRPRRISVKKFLRPTMSAGEGSFRNSVVRDSTSANAGKNSFIFFSVHQSSSSSNNRPESSQGIENLQELASPSSYPSTNQSLRSSMMSNPERALSIDEQIRHSIWNAIGKNTRSRSKPMSAVEVGTFSIDQAKSCDSKSTATYSKTSPRRSALSSATSKSNICQDQDSIRRRRRSSFDGFFQNRRGEAAQNPTYQSSWRDLTKERDEKRRIEEDNEEEFMAAEKEIQGVYEDNIDEEDQYYEGSKAASTIVSSPT